MSSPMEVTLQSATSETAVEDCKQTEVVPESSTCPIPPATVVDDKVFVLVEVCLKPSSTARADDARKAIERLRNFSRKFRKWWKDETNLVFDLIDIAFVDRADIKAYVGPPTLQARYELLRSCVQELVGAGILACSQDHDQTLLPNYSTLKEKLHSSQRAEHQGSLHLSKLLLEAA